MDFHFCSISVLRQNAHIVTFLYLLLCISNLLKTRLQLLFLKRTILRYETLLWVVMIGQTVRLELHKGACTKHGATSSLHYAIQLFN